MIQLTNDRIYSEIELLDTLAGYLTAGNLGTSGIRKALLENVGPPYGLEFSVFVGAVANMLAREPDYIRGALRARLAQD
ncbi:MAG: hypothetical protein ACLQVJ_02845 [Syntrophobacteraceae bacterium]